MVYPYTVEKLQKNVIKELPPNVAKEPEKVDDQIDIPIAPKDSNDSKEGEHQYII